MAIVGGFGLAATMSTNILERTREPGVMRAIGGGAGSDRERMNSTEAISPLQGQIAVKLRRVAKCGIHVVDRWLGRTPVICQIETTNEVLNLRRQHGKEIHR